MAVDACCYMWMMFYSQCQQTSCVRLFFLPVLKEAFKLSVTWVDRKKGGSFEFLKRLYIMDVGFERLDIYSETKHIKQYAEMFRKANGGKAAKLHCTPAVDDSVSGTYRSLVGFSHVSFT